MTVKELILREMKRVPEQYLAEILHFIRFLGAKASEEGPGTAIASESCLEEDWLKPEEEEAWKCL